MAPDREIFASLEWRDPEGALQWLYSLLCYFHSAASDTFDKKGWAGNWRILIGPLHCTGMWRSLWIFPPKLKSWKKNCAFFSLNLFSIPRDIPWHHWKNLLTSKRGHSGGSNFFTKFGQIWLKTSGGSRDLNFDLIYKCHTILESSWLTDLIFQEPHDLRGHWRLPEAAENEKNGPRNFWAYSLTDPKFQT